MSQKANMYRIAFAEDEIRKTAEETRKMINLLGSRSSLLEAALKVIMKHGLIEEFAREHVEEKSIKRSSADGQSEQK